MCIGLVASIARGFPADLLRAFSQCHDRDHIELVDGEAVGHTAALQNLDLDIAFLVGPSTWPGCDAATLWSERVSVLMPKLILYLAARG
ncbi:LysR substrate-binding domain-containing protein [Rhizobium sp. 60-20]|uniref:LysR substrate-binding domain-containing protein n=1 Tax=Rhizobium sp. 60-20 TaxID=1895819 RepID=UPI00343EC824